jgi:hypothetical protein
LAGDFFLGAAFFLAGDLALGLGLDAAFLGLEAFWGGGRGEGRGGRERPGGQGCGQLRI